MERLSSPRRLYRDQQGKTQVDETVDNGLNNLSWSEHLGQAMCELIEHLPTDGYTNSNAATLVAHIDVSDLSPASAPRPWTAASGSAPGRPAGWRARPASFRS